MFLDTENTSIGSDNRPSYTFSLQNMLKMHAKMMQNVIPDPVKDLPLTFSLIPLAEVILQQQLNTQCVAFRCHQLETATCWWGGGSFGACTMLSQSAKVLKSSGQHKLTGRLVKVLRGRTDRWHCHCVEIPTLQYS